MLIGISGNRCSGKNTVREYLGLVGFSELKVMETDDDAKSITNGLNKLAFPITISIPTVTAIKEKDSEPQTSPTQKSPTQKSSTPKSPTPMSPTPESSNQSPDPTSTEESTRVSSPTTSASEFATSPLPQSHTNYPSFQSTDQLLEFVTKTWYKNYYVDIPDLKTLEILSKRPFFLHVSIDAPTTLRWKRFERKHKNPNNSPPITFSEFVESSDKYLFGSAKGALLNSKAQVVIINKAESILELFVTIGKLNLTESTRLRPSWDAYFMQLADLAAQRSNCMKRRVGCVLVRDKRVIATGYNGTPRGIKNCSDGGCKRCNMAQGSGAGLATCLCLHAEENAILEAGRDRLGTEGILYCNTCPCLTCSIKIVQSGIREVVYSQSYSMDTESAKVLEAGGILLRQYSPPMHGLVM